MRVEGRSEVYEEFLTGRELEYQKTARRQYPVSLHSGYRPRSQAVFQFQACAIAFSPQTRGPTSSFRIQRTVNIGKSTCQITRTGTLSRRIAGCWTGPPECQTGSIKGKAARSV